MFCGSSRLLRLMYELDEVLGVLMSKKLISIEEIK